MRATPTAPESAMMFDVVSVALLTGGGDKHYAYGITTALLSHGASVEVIGSNEFDSPEFMGKPGLRLLNLRGDMRTEVGFVEKMLRVIRYYLKLICYAATGAPKVFHILWNNKFETIDRTVLMLYYRLLGKRVILTAHNVNTARRDEHDSLWNRITLRTQYALCNHIFVHTEKMKAELVKEFGVSDSRITVIPYGINNAVPSTDLSLVDARRSLRIGNGEKVLLFFGRIAPAKGLDILISAFRIILASHQDYRLVIAGRPDRCQSYWESLKNEISSFPAGKIVLREDFIPDEEIEIFFKAADVLVLPYRHIYQSGVLFLGQSFGLPALVSDVGSLKEDTLASNSGFVFRPEDPDELVSCVYRFFASELYLDTGRQRQRIQTQAFEQHSWTRVGKMILDVYTRSSEHADLEKQGSGLA